MYWELHKATKNNPYVQKWWLMTEKIGDMFYWTEGVYIFGFEDLHPENGGGHKRSGALQWDTEAADGRNPKTQTSLGLQREFCHFQSQNRCDI